MNVLGGLDGVFARFTPFSAGLQTGDRHDSVKIGPFFAFIGDIVQECGPLMVYEWFKSDGAGAGGGEGFERV